MALPVLKDHTMNIVVEPIENSLRDLIIQPDRVVVTPGYLTRWIPYIGVTHASILLAFFQAYYQSHRACAVRGMMFEAPAPRMAEIAGMSLASFWRHLDDPELAIFIEKVPFAEGEPQWVEDQKTGVMIRRPNRYQFRTLLPVTPGDARDLRAYLERAGIRKDPETALRRIIAERIEPKDVFRFPAHEPEPDWIHGPFESVTDIILHMANDSRKEIIDMAGEIASRLIPPRDLLYIPLYFLVHWMPILGEGPGWTINLLRDRCYYNRETGELRDQEYIKGGYEELGRAIGISRVKTMREWFPVTLNRAASSSDRVAKLRTLQQNIARFAVVTDPEIDGRKQVYAFTMQTNMFTPLTPEHEVIYSAVLDVMHRYQNWSETRRSIFLGAFETQVPDDLGANETQVHADLGAFETQVYTNLGAFETMEAVDLGAFETQVVRFWAHLRRFKLFNTEILKTLFNHLNLNTTTTPNPAPVENKGEEVEDEITTWDANKLLEAGNIQNVASELSAAGVTVEAILSCYLYMASEVALRGNLGPGYAVFQLRKNAKEGQGGHYYRLAQLPPTELMDLIESHIRYNKPPSNKLWQRAMGNTTVQKLFELVDRLGLNVEYFEDVRAY